MLKRGIFLILHFGRQANGGAIAPPPAPPPLATLLDVCTCNAGSLFIIMTINL